MSVCAAFVLRQVDEGTFIPHEEKTHKVSYFVGWESEVRIGVLEKTSFLQGKTGSPAFFSAPWAKVCFYHCTTAVAVLVEMLEPVGVKRHVHIAHLEQRKKRKSLLFCGWEGETRTDAAVKRFSFNGKETFLCGCASGKGMSYKHFLPGTICSIDIIRYPLWWFIRMHFLFSLVPPLPW